MTTPPSAPIPPPAPARPSALRRRLIIVVALALTPMLALSAVQAVVKYQDTKISRRDRLATSALLAADRVGAIISGAQALLEAIGSQDGVQAGGAACDRVMRNVLLGSHDYSNLKRFEADSRVSCSALSLAGVAVENVREGGPWFDDLRAGAEFVVSEVFFSQISKSRVVVAATPIRSAAGAFDGALGVSIDVSRLDAFIDFTFLPPGSSVALVDGGGAVISARLAFPYELIPKELIAAAIADPQRVHLADEKLYPGEDLLVAPLVGDDVFVVLSASDPSLLSWAQVDLIGTVLLPLFMWLIALTAVSLASDRLVLRWLEYLGRIVSLYGSGRFDIEPVRAARAPAEIADLAATMRLMAGNLKAREGELREAAAQKAALIREVHHRVKNNLQIIVSLFNIQISNAADDDTIAALEEARARVNALALVHRSLYEAEELTIVRLRPFLTELLGQLAQAAGASRLNVSVEARVDEVALPPDEAVPLALFVTEAVTNSLKHAFADRSHGTVRVSLRRLEERRLRLDVEDDGVGGAKDGEDGAGMGGALMRGFARQLGAEIVTGAGALGGLAVTIEFATSGSSAG